MNGSRTLIVPTLILATLMICTSHVRGQEPIDREAKLKAALVAVLSKFVSWPEGVAPGGEEPLKIGVLGEDPFQQGDINYLDQALSDRLQGKRVVIQRFATVDAYLPCHILVISPTADEKTAFAKTQGQPVLSIAQAPGLARQGAVINLVVVQNRIKMQINPDAAKRAGLTIDSRVYRLPTVEIIRDS